jgi:hypothetical protein
MAKAGLGLSTEHRGLLMSSHISVVFHIAGSVNFQHTLLETMQTNAWAAIEVVRLCQAMPNVKVKKPGSVCAKIIRKTCTFFMSEVFPICLLLMHIYFQIKLQYFEN